MFADSGSAKDLHAEDSSAQFSAQCGRKAVRTWEHLESSLLAIFLGRYLELPEYNKKRGSIRYAEDVTLFKRKTLEQILLRFVT
jgi:hypothetical protein